MGGYDPNNNQHIQFFISFLSFQFWNCFSLNNFQYSHQKFGVHESISHHRESDIEFFHCFYRKWEKAIKN